MTDKTAKSQADKAPLRAAELREARLKAALKANMARRKAQAKQRGAEKNSPDTSSATQEQPGTGSGAEKE